METRASSSKARAVMTVAQLTQAIKLSLEATFPVLMLQGEISNFKRQTSGHLYFSLKDATAQISAVMFRSAAEELKLLPKEGDQVIVTAELTVYPPRGNYQLVVKELQMAGAGALLLKLEELKKKLHQRGFFSIERKKSLPSLPRCIGVVTSPTGAVIQDILHVLTRRYANFRLLLNPVKVQGEGAAEEIARAIEQFNQYGLADVLIVGRGGGSIEDLWAFNEERVAEAIFQSQIPIIAAVGHETDVTIADLVADVRAPTPSAAAEMVMAEKGQLLRALNQASGRLKQTLGQLLRQQRARLLSFMRYPLLASASALLGHWMQRLDYLRQDHEKLIVLKLRETKRELISKAQQVALLNPLSLFSELRKRLQVLEMRLLQTWRGQLESRRRLFDPRSFQRRLDSNWTRIHRRLWELLNKTRGSLEGIDPNRLLKRGYSILFSEKGNLVINSVKALSQGQSVRIFLSDGEAQATINSICQKPREPETH